jgi:hypothetical protein
MAVMPNLSAEERIMVICWSALNNRKGDEWKALHRFVQKEKQNEDGKTLGHNLRTFLDGLRYHFLKTFGKEFDRAVVGMKVDEFLIRAAVEITLENATLPRFLPKLQRYFAEISKARDEAFRKNAQFFLSQTQEELHIPEAYRHAQNYPQSVKDMQEIEKDQMPSEMLDSLLKCVRSIFSEAATVSNNVMAGDDLLPVLIFVLIRANLSAPCARSAFAWDLCDPEQLQSEGGYYLTVFESALEWVASQNCSLERVDL